jgi:putative SOS response-associated peptidase YedK
MCGRFHNHVKDMHNWTDVLRDWPQNSELGYNVSPTAMVPVVTNAGTVTARWGLVPSWEKAFSTKYPTHNARLETASEKPSFRSAWKNSRTALIPVAGFYEWRKEGSIKQPYFIHKPEDLLVFAGLWEQWDDRVSFTILTTQAEGEIAKLHHRMPVMLNKSDAISWLEKGNGVEEMLSRSSVSESLEIYAVSTQVNASNTQGPELIQRLKT